MNLKSLILFVLTLLSVQKSISQDKITDSIEGLSYNELKTGFFKSLHLDSLANKYAVAQLKLARKNNNVVEIAN